MADIIRITAEDINNLGTQFANAAEETDQLLVRLERSVDSVASAWEGDAYNAFDEKYAEIKQQMQSVVEMYNNINEMLQQVVTAMQSADSEIAGSIRG